LAENDLKVTSVNFFADIARLDRRIFDNKPNLELHKQLEIHSIRFG